MNVIRTNILDIYILEPQIFRDKRGYFMESWSKSKMEEAGFFYDFVQDNQSFSFAKGTVRGLYFQKGIHAQAKLVCCTKGAVLDVAVDIRKGSPTYKNWIAIELSAENKRQLIIPRGFAHGFVTLTDQVEFSYKADNFYNPESECCIRWNDPTIGVAWGIKNPIVSEEDNSAPFFDDTQKEYFVYQVKK